MRSQVRILSIMFIILLTTMSFSGQIYGTLAIVSGGKKFVQKNVEIKIIPHSNPENAYIISTDKYGYYRIYLKETGKCTLGVHYGNSDPTIEIHSYKNPVRYNLVLKKKGENYQLRRE